MTSESIRSNLPLQTTHPINFLVIGGGIAGLAAALALRRVGHNVKVLERADKAHARGSGGVRLPPNATKIFFHWGLRQALYEKALITHTIFIANYETGELLGEHVWDPGMLAETRGMYMLCTHEELYDILYDAAISLGAEIEYSANVVRVSPRNREVILASGKILSGDALIGADSEHGLCRTTILAHQPPAGIHTGVAMYLVTIPSKYLVEYIDDMWRDNAMYAAFGDGAAMVAYPIHHGEDIAFNIYGRHHGDGFYTDEPTINVMDIVGRLRPDLAQRLVYARKCIRIPIVDYPDLDDWMSEEGPFVLIGQAAHPFPPGSIQGVAMTIEDCAVLAKLFSHLSEKRQIRDLMSAFQDLRLARTSVTRVGEVGHVFYQILSGEPARQRDDRMRAKKVDVLYALGDVSEMWDQVFAIFWYDCEDEADDWWVRWGMLKERALETNSLAAPRPPLVDFSTLRVQVTSRQHGRLVQL